MQQLKENLTLFLWELESEFQVLFPVLFTGNSCNFPIYLVININICVSTIKPHIKVDLILFAQPLLSFLHCLFPHFQHPTVNNETNLTGTATTAKPLNTWLAYCSIRHILLDTQAQRQDVNTQKRSPVILPFASVPAG